MQELISIVSGIKTIEAATQFLLQKASVHSDKIKETIYFCVEAHKGQTRKSGEDYAVHPILVASIVSHFGGSEDMIKAALLHDVVEDTGFEKTEVAARFGASVAELVDGLTKIDEIREHELPPSYMDEKLLKAALSFRKMLSSAIDDPRVLVIKLSDRLHNLLTLDALEPKKQRRIAEESLVVYAPIAYKLGISKLKNYIEDLSFKILFADDYAKIDEYMQKNSAVIEAKLAAATIKIRELLIKNGMDESSFFVKSRVKHYFSIYQKMQRKGVSLDEVLDLLALRIIVSDTEACYKALGLLHTNFKPLVGRFKDYVAIPKENGYQTIHTTLFYDNTIFEAQIRSYDMDEIAEFGFAAHSNYKSGVSSTLSGTKWLKNFEFHGDTAMEFYEFAKNDLISEDIVVYSPKGELFTLPVGATVLDFAYAVHTEVGHKAKESYVNNVKVPLIHTLNSGDICNIITDSKPQARCTWIDNVKTSRAKHLIRGLCALKLKELDRRVAKNILAHTFGFDYYELRSWLDDTKYSQVIYKIPRDKAYYQEFVKKIKEESSLKSRSLFTRIMGIKIKKYHFDHFDFYSNKPITELSFDVCCHPKKWDDIVAFFHKGRATIHHKLCSHADELIAAHQPMLYAEWSKSEIRTFRVVVALENHKGALASFVLFLAKHDINIVALEIGKTKAFTEYCTAEIEIKNDFKSIKDKIGKNFKLIDFAFSDDAYKENQ
ncbi:MAG TPA: RelA/SpoT family protein [Campylobacterales bacterium]|nr:RelA/SpoT family protein [Campylobacterales bacterium]